MRTGVLGRKIGMTGLFSEDGSYVSGTILDVKGCQVVDVRTSDKDGYNAVQVGFGEVKSKNTSKPLRHYFAKQKVSIKKKISEFRVSKESLLSVGDVISAEHYVCGQKVDVSAVSIGKGFAGVMKRHNFKGLRASHGVSVSHRSHGSTGQCQDPGKVFKGKKMAGHMGNKNITVQNLEVIKVDKDSGLILVKGAVPGPSGGFVKIKDAIKKKTKLDIPFPAALEKSLNKIKNSDSASNRENDLGKSE